MTGSYGLFFFLFSFLQNDYKIMPWAINSQPTKTAKVLNYICFEFHHFNSTQSYSYDVNFLPILRKDYQRRKLADSMVR